MNIWVGGLILLVVVGAIVPRKHQDAYAAVAGLLLVAAGVVLFAAWFADASWSVEVIGVDLVETCEEPPEEADDYANCYEVPG